MSNDLLNIIKEKIFSKYGESILSDPKRMAALFADLAQDVPKPQKNAFIKCLEHGFVQVLKNVEKTERDNCKQRLAKKLHNEEGLDIGLCEESLGLLEEVMFGKVKNTKNKKNVCKKCNKELQEEWKTCPFCSDSKDNIQKQINTASKKTKTAPKPIKKQPVIVPVKNTKECKTCLLIEGEGVSKRCKFYGCSIDKAAEYDCDMKKPNSHQLQKSTKAKQRLLYWTLTVLFSGPCILIFYFIINGAIGLIADLLRFINLDFIVDFIESTPLGSILNFLIILFSVFISFTFSFIVEESNQKKRRENAKRL